MSPGRGCVNITQLPMHLKCLSIAAGTAAALVFSSQAAGQTSRNVTLVGQFNPTRSYSDIWGYLAPNGKEYALLAATNGTYVVDCSDPANPVQRGFFSGSSTCCRDIRTYGTYAYVVNEGGGGLQVIDLTDPDAPTLATTVRTSALNTAHNVSVDVQNGIMYVPGANGGMPILDLTDPANPAQISVKGGSYVHDMQAQDGYAYVAEIFNSRLAIWDLSSGPSGSRIGSVSISTAHNAWPSRDNQVLAVTSEVSGGRMTFVDIANKRLPRSVSTWRTGGSGAIPHNAFMRDRVCHVSYYSEGYRSLDLTDPASPREVAYYDASRSTSGYSGAWGCYPFQPSGLIYVSDMSQGLLVLRSASAHERYGAATAGAGGAPTAHTFGAAYHGNARFKLQLEDAAPGAAALLLVGAARGVTPVSGATVLIDVTQPAAVVSTTTDATGAAEVAIPVLPGPTGTVHCQWLVSDAGAPGGIAATRGLSVAVFAP